MSYKSSAEDMSQESKTRKSSNLGNSALGIWMHTISNTSISDFRL